jgi:hypothetical protein
MTQRDYIQEEVQKTLDCLDRMPRLDGNPFLYTRIALQLSAMMRQPSARTSHRVATILKPVLLGLLIVFNIITLARTLTSASADTASRSDLVDSITHEYQIGIDPRTQLLMTETR